MCQVFTATTAALRDVDIKDCLIIDDYNYDVILANINKDVLIALLDRIKNQGKYIILSGILHKDEKDIKLKLQDYNREIISVRKKEEWSCIVVK